LVSLVAACEPEPHFATPEPPVPGLIVTEESLVTTGSDQQLKLLYGADIEGEGGYRIRVSVPGDAYPVGTRVTVRVLSQLASDLGRGVYLSALNGSAISALQILPAGRDPARPLHIEMVEFLMSSQTHLLVHAREGDEVWSVVSSLDMRAKPVSFDATQAGLWTTVSNLPDYLLGRLKRTSLTCDGWTQPNPAPVLLDLSNGIYTATTVDTRGCHVTQTAPTIFREFRTCFMLASESCPEWTETGLTLSWTGGSSECASAKVVNERYQRLTWEEALPPEPATCQSKEGTRQDGGRD
jgi:hypothetical protein